MQDNQQTDTTPSDYDTIAAPQAIPILNSKTVLHPSSEFMRELQARADETIAPTAQPASSQTVRSSMQSAAIPQPGPTHRPALDIDRIYPPVSSTPTPSNIQQTDTRPTDAPLAAQRVATRAPSLQVYAIIALIYHSLSALVFFIVALRYLFAFVNPLSLLMLLPGVILNIVPLPISLSLLLTKSVQLASLLLSALLVLGCVGFIYTLASSIGAAMRGSGLSAFTSLGISGALLAFLWSVKNSVAMLRAE